MANPLFTLHWVGFDDMRKRLTGIAKEQMPFATARALTRVAQIAQAETSMQLRTRLQAPTEFATNSIFVRPATKTALSSMVYVKNMGRVSTGKRKKTGKSQEEVLGHLFSGGSRAMKGFEVVMLRRLGVLPNGWAAVPGAGVALDSHGNIPRGFFNQMISYFNANLSKNDWMTSSSRKRFENRIGKKNAGAVQFFISRGKGNWFGKRSWKSGRLQNLPPGIWMRTSYGHGGTSIKPIIMFVRTPNYKRYFNLPEIAQQAFDRNFGAEFAESLADAIRTAK